MISALVKPVDGFVESIAITVADATDGRLDSRLRQPLVILDRRIAAAIGMVDEPAMLDGPPIMKRLVECIENETRMGSPARPPTDDAASEGIDHERDVNEASLSRHIREIRKPEHVWRGSVELSVHPVERAGCGFVRPGSFDGPAASDA